MGTKLAHGLSKWGKDSTANNVSSKQKGSIRIRVIRTNLLKRGESDNFMCFVVNCNKWLCMISF